MDTMVDQLTLDAPATEPTSEIAVLPRATLPTILAADTQDILGQLARKIAAHKPDISTAKGRKEIASLAAEVASSKMDLIRLGKGLTEGWRAQTKAVNDECRIIEDRMDALKIAVRKPLTDFEDAEKARVAGHEEALRAIPEHPGYGTHEFAAEIAARIDMLRAWPSRNWQEFAQRAADTLAAEIERMERLHAAAVKREAEAAELARLRALEDQQRREDEARRQAEREAEIARAAAEAATRQAEERATAEAKRAAEAAEHERLAVLEREAQAKRQAEDAERRCPETGRAARHAGAP